MDPIKLTVAKIGNSRGVRLPAKTLERYAIGDRVIMEETSDGILLRPDVDATPKLSWADTARAMSTENEDWSEWDATAGDGLTDIVWDSPPKRRVAESPRDYDARPRKPSK